MRRRRLCEAIAFRHFDHDDAPDVQPDSRVELAYRLDVNQYNGLETAAAGAPTPKPATVSVTSTSSPTRSRATCSAYASQIVRRIRTLPRATAASSKSKPRCCSPSRRRRARPFVTHHNTLDIQLYLRIAARAVPQAPPRRRLQQGLRDRTATSATKASARRHNPEFTMLEAYEAFGSWETMADMVEELVCHVAETVFGTLRLEHRNDAGDVTKTINLTRPWSGSRYWTSWCTADGLRFPRTIRTISSSTCARTPART